MKYNVVITCNYNTHYEVSEAMLNYLINTAVQGVLKRELPLTNIHATVARDTNETREI